jgi:hypothetical protein
MRAEAVETLQDKSGSEHKGHWHILRLAPARSHLSPLTINWY